ncbi:HAMP domain-containing sensor histidine kinase [Hoeflea sp.]|uniref:sensor histidine kinase n=1 Tax=Hoeflea sp. TaxID=1940281 RepID=UPI00199C3A75|nr:HAMP domain-containing sensor histidine kinase [Hoeflea sp.]MBC7285066.1 HAMP domain-containing histidine kinase [Hoeflea sp.]
MSARALRLADKRKNEFISVIGHELRNPLAALNGGLKLLSRKPEATRAEQIHGHMQEQMEHVIRLIDDLLDAYRIAQGKINLAKSTFDLREAIASAVEMTRPVIEEREHALTLRAPETPCMIFADKVRLTQCVSNLLNNAAKYTPQGGRIDVSLEAREEAYRISVADNGLGLTPEGAKAIFEMVEQIEEHSDHAHGGLGIGLALAKQLMELHGGDVTVWSDGPGRGSVVSLELTRSVPAPGDG